MIDSSQEKSVRTITLNYAPVNALGTTMRGELLSELERAFADDSVDTIVLASALPLFCGGADIQEFQTGELWQYPDLPYLCDVIDNAPKRVIAAINGTAMGGALEIALACDYRIGAAGAQLGLPEIKLGLLPGAGGTQRLPRITNISVALEMILSGEPIMAGRALEVGLLDHVVDDDLNFNDATTQFAQEQTDIAAPKRYSSEMSVSLAGETTDIFQRQVETLSQRKPGQIAPLRCVESIELAYTEPLSIGLQKEKQYFLELLRTPQARAQIHLFFSQRIAQKLPDIDATTEHRIIHSAAVIGAGTMGSGIAIALANANIAVLLLDASGSNLSAAMSYIKTYFERAVEKGRLSESEALRRQALVSAVRDFEDLSGVELVIEAVYEHLATKQSVFKKLDQFCKSGAILASNTSSLDLNDIAASTNRADDVIGLHFFSPAHIMKLTEIVRGQHTSPSVIKSAIQFTKKIGKVPAVVNVCDGFVGNRMLEPYFREASRLLLEGATVEQIDGVLTRFGMAMGVLSMGDLAGIDVGYLVREANRSRYSRDPSYQAVQDKLYSLGRYGQKTGRGCYLYKGKEKITDAQMPGLCLELAFELQIKRRIISDTEVLERCLYPLINEGFKILEEGIAYRASDCDIIWVNGYGFPAWRGGPMYYANEIGLDVVLAGIKKYQTQLEEYGDIWFQPAALLEELVEYAH